MCVVLRTSKSVKYPFLKYICVDQQVLLKRRSRKKLPSYQRDHFLRKMKHKKSNETQRKYHKLYNTGDTILLIIYKSEKSKMISHSVVQTLY